MKKLIFISTILLLSICSFAQKRVAQPKTKAEILDETYTSGLFKTQNADYFDLLNDQNAHSATSYFNILDWLQGRVAGLQIYTTRNGIRIPFIRNQRASVFVDEIPVSYDYLNALPVTDIAMIKIIKGPFAGSRGAGGGAIAIYTIRGDEEGEEE
jgi:hypothetical protein